jgi:import receptor subunit TOM22
LTKIVLNKELDETLSERLWGLTEMFPECVRNGFYNVSNGSLISVKYLYGLSGSALWVLFTSSAILLAPLALELERSQMEEYSRQQQRQVFFTFQSKK